MEGSVLDQKKKEKKAPKAADESVLAKKPDTAASESVLSKKAESKAETSVLSQKAEKPAAKTKQPSGEQSVLGGPSTHKPVTFYKKAWFWIIIAVVVLGTAGLIVFLVIQSNLTAEAIEKYGKNAREASVAATEFESEFSTAYNDSGLSSYYSSVRDGRGGEYRDKCLDKFGVSGDTFREIDEIKTFDGEILSNEIGSGKTRELSEKYEKAAEGLKKAKEEINTCKDMLTEILNSHVEIKVGDFVVENENSSWPDTELKLTVTNKDDVAHSFYFKVKALDEDGKELRSSTVYAYSLEPGASKDYKTFTFVYRTEIEDLKKAKFEISDINETSY